MADIIAEQLKIRLGDLERKANARRGTPGFKDNVIEIDAVIDVVKAEIETREAAEKKRVEAETPAIVVEPKGGEDAV